MGRRCPMSRGSLLGEAESEDQRVDCPSSVFILPSSERSGRPSSQRNGRLSSVVRRLSYAPCLTAWKPETETAEL
jgi:hypothetical protein